MRLVQFTAAELKGAARAGVEVGAEVVDLCAAAGVQELSMRALLARGAEGLELARAAVRSGQHRRARDAIQLLAPITDPEKILCIGMNYRDHCHEQNVPVPKEPIVFCKFANAIAASGDAIRLQETEELDFEVELAVVMGRAAHRVSAEEARRCIAGYTVAHDVSARDWQLKRNGGQWFLGKSFDTFAPIGPAIVTSDELGDPHRLGIRCFLNDAPVQSSNTDQLIFRCEDLVAWVSRFMTLRPGDLIFTGTPPGVGVFRKPPLFLKHGDVVRCEIDGIGAITNRVEAAAPQRPAP